MSRRSISIRELAAAAGVSVGTASRALKHQQGLSAETRDRVLQLAAELGYDTGRLKQEPVRRILVLLHSQHPADSPFYAALLDGARDRCAKDGVEMQVRSLGPGRPVRRQVLECEPDALLCVGFFEPELIHAIARLGKPLALADLWAPGLAAVNPDNRQGAYLATQHLLANGRKRIAFLSGPLAHYSIRLRERGYRQALFDAGRLADPSLEALIAPGLDVATGAAQAMRELLALPVPPDAVFAYNDTAALVALQVCRDTGLRVPDDIAVAGFDDIAGAAGAGLTTLAVDKAALGRAGIELLLNQADEGNRLQPVSLIVRTTTASTPE
ncbi:LacI family DNA-binding transcriptional regulator [Jeongeupia chitinilytica]|uniref:LacI family transcriptional regulator n=1 Tax=Jeongeupia chitinilytica TaxID=1041641 RepID=A0ABQ3H3W6_9NEIS|nr:LacI family DNA-binding transcriptional regulator [Jeongeupia chitinilytica]GHD69161.1 LacI family transcriptional regulator [Jeongeupia chitinilytica]